MASYLGLVPLEESSRESPQAGTHYQAREFDIAFSAWVEAAQVTARSLPEWRSKYFHVVDFATVGRDQQSEKHNGKAGKRAHGLVIELAS